MNLGFVVTTLGRIDALRVLLSSLEGQLSADDRVVIVAQGKYDEVVALGDEFGEGGLPVIVRESGRGASLGRNTGVAALPHQDYVVNFPNDNTVFPAGVVDRIRSAAENPDFLAGGFTSWDERGPKTMIPDAGTRLDQWNVWTVIEMGILMRRSLFDSIGGFDEQIGPGASTPWQVAEGTDLLLRALAARRDLADRFAWLPHDVYVEGISTAYGLTRPETRRKMRAYGRGTGHAMSIHRYPWWWRTAFTFAGLLYGVRNPRPITLADGWPMFVGRLEGQLGWTFGRPQLVSATR